MSRQGRVSAGIVIWRQNSGAIAVECGGEIAVFTRVLPKQWPAFSRAVTTKSPMEISRKMVASMQNRSEKLLPIFLTKIPINSNQGVFYACFAFARLKFSLTPCLFLATHPKFSIN